MQSRQPNEPAWPERASPNPPWESGSQSIAPTTRFFDELRVLADTYPNVAGIEDVGRSIEGRYLRAIHLGTDADAPTVVLSGGQHARE